MRLGAAKTARESVKSPDDPSDNFSSFEFITLVEPKSFRCARIITRSLSSQMKYWEIIADNLSKAGWGWGYVSAVDSEGRTIWIADAHRGDGKRFIVQADELLTAFLELESAIRAGQRCCIDWSGLFWRR
jgi:hypothetical protein